ncbi:MAG: hypothetical protein DI617_06985 [Streptococcus pyogenes]|nr:MAG: hypothetical protein DI617_06985 [Streptococcus pyogenes]
MRCLAFFAVYRHQHQQREEPTRLGPSILQLKATSLANIERPVAKTREQKRSFTPSQTTHLAFKEQHTNPYQTRHAFTPQSHTKHPASLTKNSSNKS